MEFNWEFEAAPTEPRFTVQQLADHYMLRLEHNGVMKSFTLPKGLTMNPKQKRLAMPSRDLPLELIAFEGVTQKGKAVLLWDQGTWEHTTTLKTFSPSVDKAISSGHMQFKLQGQKLNGEFILRKLKRGSAQWLLLKKSDECAVDHDINEDEKSVKSGKTLKQLS